MDLSLLPLLACPKCRGNLKQLASGTGLECATCKVVYPIFEGIPRMLPEAAVPSDQWDHTPSEERKP